MNEQKTDEKQAKTASGKSLVSVNLNAFAGLLAGGFLGLFLGWIFHDLPLYTGFGMILGMALAFDLTTHRKTKASCAEETKESD